MRKKCIFLDSSVQVPRRFGMPKLRQGIQNILDKYSLLVSSTYVRMEFTHSFIRDLIYLYDLSMRLSNLSEILCKIETLPNVIRRKINRLLQGLAIFFLEVEGDILNERNLDILEKLQLWLPHVIDESWEWFNESLDYVVDGTGCKKASVAPVRIGDTYQPFGGCKKSEKKCKIDEFFRSNITNFESIVDELKNLPSENKDEELLRMEKVLEKALSYPEDLLDSKNCWKCGDAIITTECPKEAILFTTNIKHYQLLCPAVDKTLIGGNEEVQTTKQLLNLQSNDD